MLLDVAAALVFIGFVVAALAPLFLASRKLAVRSFQTQEGARLASGLLEEIRVKKWDARGADGSAQLGPDAGEDPADKTAFDDADDYAGWSESPPKDVLGAALPGTNGYALSVAVAYIGPSGEESGSPTALKKVTVVASRGEKNLARISTVLAKP